MISGPICVDNRHQTVTYRIHFSAPVSANEVVSSLELNLRLKSFQVSLSPCLKGVHVGMKVEVVNCSMDVIDDTDVAFWVAAVIEIKHYRVQLRYEGYESDPAGDFWFDLRSKNIHPVGWCAKRNKLLIPPPGKNGF